MNNSSPPLPTSSSTTLTIKTVLGFDFGTRYIGLAVGQSLTQSATPLPSLHWQQEGTAKAPDWQKLDRVVKEWRPQALVVGIPVKMDGSAQAITAQALQFQETLKARYNLPVFSVDERLSTKEARELLFERGGSKALTKQKIDSLAACLIVASWFRQYVP